MMSKAKTHTLPCGEFPADKRDNRAAVWFCAIAMFAGIAAGGSLGVRSIRSVDIGYHLMYGESFLRTGKPVDSSPDIYTIPANLGNAELPPGSWIDSQGRYRFPNANWLTQIIFAVVYNAGGAVGLSILRLMMVLGILMISAITMRRLGVPVLITGAGVMLTALAAEERFLLRPELMGYLILTAQLCLLLPDALNSRDLSWIKIVLLIVLQLLLVNLHSYWMLGLGITGAVLGDRVIRVVWGKIAVKKTRDEGFGRGAKVLVILFVAQVLVCFVNPWTWRIVLLPIQTLIFFKQHDIPGSFGQSGSHPWSGIGEIFPSFHNVYTGRFGTYILIFVLGLGVVGIFAAAIRRRWALVLLIIAMGGVSISMRRNIAVAVIIIIPVALGAIVSLLREKFPVVLVFCGRVGIRISCGAALILAAAGLFYSTVSDRFYSEQLRAGRFALGLNRVVTPASVVGWLNARKPKGRIWSDYTSSSNVFFFSTYADTPSGHPQASILTNTWAYPVETMKQTQDITEGRIPYRGVFDRYGVEVVVLQNDTVTMKPHRRQAGNSSALTLPLGLELQNDPGWSLVHIDPTHLIFIRNKGVNSALAAANTVAEYNFDTKTFMKRLKDMDPVTGDVLRVGGVALQRLGWYKKSIKVLRAAIDENPDSSLGWFELGASCALRGAELKQFGDWSSARGNFKEAQKCFERALELKPGYKPAVFNLSRVRYDLQSTPK